MYYRVVNRFSSFFKLLINLPTFQNYNLLKFALLNLTIFLSSERKKENQNESEFIVFTCFYTFIFTRYFYMFVFTCSFFHVCFYMFVFTCLFLHVRFYTFVFRRPFSLTVFSFCLIHSVFLQSSSQCFPSV